MVVKVPRGSVAPLFSLCLLLDQIRNCPALLQAYAHGILDLPGSGNQILEISLFTGVVAAAVGGVFDQKILTRRIGQLLCLPCSGGCSCSLRD